MGMIEKNIIVFGAGEWGVEMLSFLKENNILVRCVFDNGSKRWGQMMADNVIIEQPRYIEDSLVIICVARYYRSIFDQLISLGYSENHIFFTDEFKLLLMDGESSYDGGVCEYPSTIQFPVTYACNFNCIMCGMPKLKYKKHASVDEIKKILQDDLFRKVEYVGINGGEPFLRNDLAECMEVMIDVLPELKGFNIISNGFFTERIVSVLKRIHGKCQDNGINVSIAISVDGIGELQDEHRGCGGAFECANKTIDILRSNPELCDSLSVICTITKKNIFNVNEVVVWAEQKDLYVNYNIATENERIANQDKVSDFSLFKDERARMMAQEFFFGLYQKTKEERYYGLFLYLREKRRYTECPCQKNKWITIYPEGTVGFCATHSVEIGNALEESARSIVNRNLNYLEQIKAEKCEKCAQYSSRLNAEGKKVLYTEELKNRMLRWK